MRKRSEREHGPDRTVRVLAAVLADAGQVAADVSRVDRGVLEGRGEQEDQAVTPTDQVLLDGGHRPLGVGRVGRSRQNAP